MRRVLIFVAVLVSILQVQTVTKAQNDIKEWRFNECRFGGVARAAWTVHEIKLTMKCAIDKWPVPGGFDKAVRVAECESGSDLMDTDDSDGYIGTYQQSVRYWPTRQNEWSPKHWDHPLAESGNNPRANIVVSIRMARTNNWHDWKQGRCGWL